MAKFQNYHVLCPLIDQKSFLGITGDKERGDVIVTLGRNVVNRYRLSDQKQIGGWTSKDHITSAIVYGRVQDEYVGVFNNNTVKMWKEEITNLDKVKKHKFNQNIFKIVLRGQLPPLVIFTNGNCASFSYAIDNKKNDGNKPLLKDSETIVDFIWNINEDTKQEYVCYVIKNSKEEMDIIHCILKEELSYLDKSKMRRLKVERNDAYIVSHLVSKEKLTVFILWSDSRITAYDLNRKFWETIGSVQWISTTSKVSMAWMGRNHIILFGSNIDEDGAIIMAYNIVLGVVLCRYPMKMYTENAQLYCFSQRILLEASNHVGVLPYTLEIKRNLSTLLGSHELVQENTMEISDWKSPIEPMFSTHGNLKDCIDFGLTDRSVCARSISVVLEKQDYKEVYEFVKQFNNIPESVLATLIKYCVSILHIHEINSSNLDEVAKFCHENYIKMKENFDLLNFVLNVSFSDALIIQNLRNLLSIDDTVFLFTYIVYLLTFSDTNLTISFETKLHDWCILLMDAFNQHYIMTKDEKVTLVLDNAKNAIENAIKVLHSVSSLMVPMNKLLFGKSIIDNNDSTLYSVELMEI